MRPVRLEPGAPWFRVKHSTTEPSTLFQKRINYGSAVQGLIWESSCFIPTVKMGTYLLPVVVNRNVETMGNKRQNWHC